ncbi:MAG: isochorismatase family protein, partial [Dehalococcoidales bacterium]|nr:isochorismatase family protein [Dehalococcoidales bacterium]
MPPAWSPVIRLNWPAGCENACRRGRVMANVVLVIDMTRTFLEEGHALYCGHRARSIIPNIQALLERELSRGARVLFLNDHHDPDDIEFRVFPPHSITGTVETEVIA